MKINVVMPQLGESLSYGRYPLAQTRLRAVSDSLVFSCVNWRTNLRN